MSTTTPSFAEALCAALDDQLDRQGRLAALCEAQAGALARRDVDQVDGLTRAVEQELLDGRDAEERRTEAATALAEELGLEASASLRDLADATGGRGGLALAQRASAFDGAIRRLRRASSVNQALIENELDTLQMLARALRSEPRHTYGGAGAYDARTVSMLDARA